VTTLVVVLLVALLVPRMASCAEPDPLFDDEAAATAPSGFPDPFERANRGVFAFNQKLDKYVLDPVGRAYAFVVPAVGRRAVRRVLANLNSPSVFVNDVLQLAPEDAGITLGRFVINSTAGVVGIFDVAKEFGLAGHFSDFGQTLALYGTPSGPFLILPAIGPTTARDGIGYVVDFAFRPLTYILTPAVQIWVISIQEGSAGIAARDAHAEALDALEESSIDYYAALRSAFYQDRMAQIYARREDWRPGRVAKAD
jgi:phospholipid-binding lipoprotein MlaA